MYTCVAFALCHGFCNSVFIRLRGFHADKIRQALAPRMFKEGCSACEVSRLLYLLRAGVRPGSMYNVVRSVPVAGR